MRSVHTIGFAAILLVAACNAIVGNESVSLWDGGKDGGPRQLDATAHGVDSAAEAAVDGATTRDAGRDVTTQRDTGVDSHVANGDVGALVDAPLARDAGNTGDAADAATLDAASACASGVAASPSLGVFVDAVNGNDISGSGLPSSPFQTITKAVNAAISTGTSFVYVAPGTYNESVTIFNSSAGLTVQGGWTTSGATWCSDPSSNARSSAIILGGTTAVTVQDVTQPSGLSRLTVATQAEAPPAEQGAPGASLIGVLVVGNGSVFSFDDVAITSGNAGAGGAASAGAPAVGTLSCNGATDCSDGAAGAQGPAGAGALTQGFFNVTGFTPAGGQAGHAGGPGDNGVPGAVPAPSLLQTAGCASYGDCNVACTASPDASAPTPITGGSGTCGCAGLGGGPGTAGFGGGASVALIISGSDASVAITGSTLVSNSGGAGTAGGAGGTGSAGSFGAGGKWHRG